MQKCWSVIFLQSKVKSLIRLDYLRSLQKINQFIQYIPFEVQFHWGLVGNNGGKNKKGRKKMWEMNEFSFQGFMDHVFAWKLM